MPLYDPYIYFGELEPSKGKPFSHSGKREYTRRFRVGVNDKNVGPVEVCECPGVPLPYSPYVIDPTRGESDLSALLVDMDAEPNNSKPGEWGSWLVTCKYSTDLGTGQGLSNTNYPNKSGGPQNNPELEPPDIEWDFQEAQRVFTKDLDGKAFVNSSLRPLNPIPVVDVAYPILTITRNELSFSRTKASQYAYALNDRPFLTADRNSVQCLPPKAKIVYKGNLVYWRVTYRLRFCVVLADGTLTSWQPKVNDNGLEELKLKPGVEIDVNLPLVAQRDKFDWFPIKQGQHPISSPVLLDGNGKQLKPNAQGIMVPVELSFRVYQERDFTDLFVRGLGA